MGPHSIRAHTRCRPCDLVLRPEAPIPGESNLHLSPLGAGYRCSDPVAVSSGCPHHPNRLLEDAGEMGPRALGRGPLLYCYSFPALGFFDVYPMRYSFVADHFQYLASIGVIAIVIGSIIWMTEQWGKVQTGITAEKWNQIWGTVGFMVLFLLGMLSWRQGYVYNNLETLWRDIYRVPKSDVKTTSPGSKKFPPFKNPHFF